MKRKVAEILTFQRPEGPEPHMQRDPRQLDPLALQCRQQLITEMQSCRGCCHRARTFGVAGLIAISIRWIVPIDIGR